VSGRPLSEVLLELQAARTAWDNEAERGNGEAMDRIDEDLDRLRLEFRDTFKELTGVAWSNVEAATMSGAL